MFEKIFRDGLKRIAKNHSESHQCHLADLKISLSFDIYGGVKEIDLWDKTKLVKPLTLKDIIGSIAGMFEKQVLEHLSKTAKSYSTTLECEKNHVQLLVSFTDTGRVAAISIWNTASTNKTIHLKE